MLTIFTFSHGMDTVTSYSNTHEICTTSLNKTFLAIESCWLPDFWPPTAVHDNNAFCKGVVLYMLESYKISICEVLSNLHQKMFEPRHGPICYIFLLLFMPILMNPPGAWSFMPSKFQRSSTDPTWVVPLKPLNASHIPFIHMCFSSKLTIHSWNHMLKLLLVESSCSFCTPTWCIPINFVLVTSFKSMFIAATKKEGTTASSVLS